MWLPPQLQHLSCCLGVVHSPEGCGSPQATHRGVYPQLRCVWPKRWQRLHWSGALGATYVSTETLKPQSSDRDRTFWTSGPLATDTTKCGVGGRLRVASWSRRPERSCMLPWTRIPRASSSSRTTLSGTCLPRFFTSRRTQRSSGREKVWKVTPLLPSRDRRAMTVALKPSAVPGTIITFSPFIWVDRRLGHKVLNHARKRKCLDIDCHLEFFQTHDCTDKICFNERAVFYLMTLSVDKIIQYQWWLNEIWI